jgi:hypothetical protein
MTNKKAIRTALTPEFRAAFPKLFEAEAMREGGSKSFGVEAVFAPDADLSALKKLASRVKNEHWGDKPPKKVTSPFIDGDEYNRRREDEGKNPRQEIEGCTLIRLNTTNKPEVVSLNPNVPITDETEIYPGCHMRAFVYCYAYGPTKEDPTRKNGITFILNHVQKLGDDEPWGAVRERASSVFDDEISEKSESSSAFDDDTSGSDSNQDTDSTDEWD